MADVKQHTCYTLKMSEMIPMLLGETDLPEYWDELFSEYVGLRENKSTKFLVQLEIEIKALKMKQDAINMSIPILAKEYHRDLVNELKREGCRGRFDWSDPVQYSNDLRAAATYAKRYTTQIASKQKELDEYSKRYGGKQLQRKDFEIAAVTLMDHFKMNIDFDLLTVARWCEMNNQYERYCEVKNASNKNLLKDGR